MRFAVSLIAAAMCAACGSGAGFASTAPAETRKPNAQCASAEGEGDAASPLRFAILPDRTGQERPGVFARAINTIDALDPQFVISVGDLIEGYSDKPATVENEWDELDALIAPLDVPFCAATGNHDVWNAASGKIWEKRRGKRYYAFKRGGALFLFLDTEDPPQPLPQSVQARQAALKKAWASDPNATQKRILDAVRARLEREEGPIAIPGQAALSKEQIDWVQSVLGEHSDARWTFVIMHRPAWRQDPNPLAQIEAALEGRDFTVIAGHEHYLQTERRFGADYIVTATSGGVWLRDGPGRLDHVLLVEMTDQADALPIVTSIPLADEIAN